MGTTLVVNPGSSSKKYALFSAGKEVFSIKFEKTATGFDRCSQYKGEQQVCEKINNADFAHSLNIVKEEVDKIIFREGACQVNAIVVRVVAPGTFFQEHREIDNLYCEKLKMKERVAPIHIPIIVKEIETVKSVFPGIKLLAASDSAFHKTIPDHARKYSIKESDAEELDIYRFGYHGLSVSSIVNRVHSIIGIDPEKLVVCHVGSGVSVTGVKNGVSLETTMGFSPTSGLPMSSRAGDLDASALLHVMKERNFNPKEAELYLDTMGGLVGLAGEADIRKLLDRKSQNDELATLALHKFSYSIKKAIASSSVALEGIDAVVVTATASVRSSELRFLILSGLEYLGIKISEDRNNLLVGKDGVINVHNSKVKVIVMRTDEMGEMASIANKFV